MARRIVELDGFLKMLMGAGKIAELKAIAAGNAVRDQGLGTVRPGRGFAQEKLRHFVHRSRFAPAQMPAPKTVVGGEPFRGVALHRIAFRMHCEFTPAWRPTLWMKLAAMPERPPSPCPLPPIGGLTCAHFSGGHGRCRRR